MIPLSRIPHRLAVPALLALYAVCGFVSMSGDAATFDETPHLGAGVSYLETGDFRLNPEHPPLAKLVAALPLKLLGRGGGDYASPAWTGATPSEWVFGFELLNGPRDETARRDPALRLLPARCAMLVLGAVLCLIVYAWSREMAGRPAALLALALAVTCPTILAHARLVTTDLPAALGIVGTSALFWRWTRKPSWPRALVTGAALAAAMLLKFNGVLLAPILVVLAALAVVARRVTLVRAASAISLAAIVAYAGLWAGYGFRYAASAEVGRSLDWAQLQQDDPGVSPAIAWAAEHRVLPEAFLYGLAYARMWAKDRVAFLDGEESSAGWYRYFPEAFLFKTPLAFIALVGWAIGSVLVRSRGRGFDGWSVGVPLVVFAGSAVSSRFNIGHRHIAPLYPLLCVAAAPAASWLEERTRRGALAAALLAGCLVSFVLATPGYLSYFNVLAGGPRGGWKHLVDSNIDWGQDLGRLKLWMDAHGVTEVDLAYFGTADPRAYGIAFRKVAMFIDFYGDKQVERPAPGRHLAVSVTLLQGVYLDADRTFATDVVRRGWVARGKVEEYLADRAAREARGQPVAHIAPWMVERGALSEAQRREIEEAHPAAWLARARDTWTPVGRAGDSILIYRVD